jgi:hypothetical protein
LSTILSVTFPVISATLIASLDFPGNKFKAKKVGELSEVCGQNEKLPATVPVDPAGRG